jgi:hypothetical protein
METFLVSSPPRTGGHYLHALLLSTATNTTTAGNIILTHNPWYELDYHNTCLILLSRRDKTAAILSQMIGKRTKQWTKYEITPDPFLVDCDLGSDLYHAYMFNRWYEKSHDLSRPYAKIQNLYFEDYVDNHDHVFSTLGLSPVRSVVLPQKSPYSYRDIIINYQDCIQTIQQWDIENHPFVTVTQPHLRTST